MSTIVTRITKGSALTYQEVDDNFTNLNTDKFEASDVGTVLQAYSANLTQFVNQFTLPTVDGNNGEALATNGAGELSFIPVSGTGTVRSVDMTVPTGLVVSGNPITTIGNFAITYQTGYSIPTDLKQTDWDSAYAATQTLGTIATQDANNVAITGGSISGITDLAVADGGTGASDASGARTNLGLGTIATQDANNVAITGGSISGITDLAVADGGTGASDASGARTNLGLGSLATQGDGDKGDITVSASGATWTIDNDAVTTAKIDTDAVTNSKIAFDGGSLGFRNKLIGGSATTNPFQLGTSFTSVTAFSNNDDAYVADRWYLLSDGNDIADFTQSTDAPTGSLYSFQFDVETANKKFGFAQIIEQRNCQALIGGIASLSFKAKVTGSSLTTIKAAVISWSGTADVVTSDIISAWNADGVTPTLIANATFENIPANLSVTTSWAEYKIENIAIDTASTKNLIVFIWCDNATTTIGDFLNIENVQLEQGSVATAFENRDAGTELFLCQRYLEKSYNQGVNPATTTNEGACFVVTAGGTNTSNTYPFSAEKRIIPTMSVWDLAGNANACSSFDGGYTQTNNNAQAAPVSTLGTKSVVFRNSNGISGSVSIAYQFLASAEM